MRAQCYVSTYLHRQAHFSLKRLVQVCDRGDLDTFEMDEDAVEPEAVEPRTEAAGDGADVPPPPPSPMLARDTSIERAALAKAEKGEGVGQFRKVLAWTRAGGELDGLPTTVVPGPDQPHAARHDGARGGGMTAAHAELLNRFVADGDVSHRRLRLLRLASVQSQQQAEDALASFADSPTARLCVIVANMRSVTVARVNLVRQLIDQVRLCALVTAVPARPLLRLLNRVVPHPVPIHTCLRAPSTAGEHVRLQAGAFVSTAGA